MFYIAQIFGLIALIILIISFQQNNKKTLLTYQIFSSIFFALQYICLNAVTGCLMNLISLIRNIIYNKYKEKIPLTFLVIIITAMIVTSIFSYDGIISLLPIIAVVLYTVALSQKNLTIVRIVEVISCFLFIIYNINVFAIIGLISSIIELLFDLVAIYRFDIKKQKDKNIHIK